MGFSETDGFQAGRHFKFSLGVYARDINESLIVGTRAANEDPWSRNRISKTLRQSLIPVETQGCRALRALWI